MTAQPHVCLIGQILVDVTLPTKGDGYKLRAGGIMHAARALWAIGCPYSMLYIAPDYLEAEIADHVRNYGATFGTRIGTVTGCPNVILIAAPKEAGPQGYEFLLRDLHRCQLLLNNLRTAFTQSQPTDILIFPGGFDLGIVLQAVSGLTARVHVDANFEPATSDGFRQLGRQFETIILSTSSVPFLERYQGDHKRLCSDLLGQHGKHVLLKENRGGSRLFASDGTVFQTPAQPRAVQHSVGVGDCFDAAFIALRHRVTDRAALAYASCLAAEYACTTYPEVFRDETQTWLAVPDQEIMELAGTILPWEIRPSVPVYIAAPDFDNVDRRPIDAAVECLKYHNFVARLPVRENGQMGPNATSERRQALCDADLGVLDECKLMLAVLLFDDPGTLIEIGIAVERGIPVIVFDPYGHADNLMLTQLPYLVSSDLDRIMTGLFICASRVLRP